MNKSEMITQIYTAKNTKAQTRLMVIYAISNSSMSLSTSLMTFIIPKPSHDDRNLTPYGLTPLMVPSMPPRRMRTSTVPYDCTPPLDIVFLNLSKPRKSPPQPLYVASPSISNFFELWVADHLHPLFVADCCTIKIREIRALSQNHVEFEARI